jgi:hypothetical protein
MNAYRGPLTSLRKEHAMGDKNPKNVQKQKKQQEGKKTPKPK